MNYAKCQQVQIDQDVNILKCLIIYLPNGQNRRECLYASDSHLKLGHHSFTSTGVRFFEGDTLSARRRLNAFGQLTEACWFIETSPRPVTD